MPQKKFIITQDESVSNILLAHGFHLVSHIGNTYTFMNETPEFNIGLSYTNMGDFCPHSFNGCDASKEEPIKFKDTIETKLKNMSV